MTESGADAVRKWLKSQGFPLEMFAAKTLQSAGFVVGHSEYFTDPTESKARETDVVARLSIPASDANTDLFLCMVVECKTSRNKAWVLLMPGTVGFSSSLHEHVWSGIVNERGKTLLKNAPEVPLPTPGFFLGNGDCAYGLVVAHSSGDQQADSGSERSLHGPSTAFAAMMSVAKSARWFRDKAEKDVPFSKLIKKLEPLYIFVPVVLVDAPLFRATLNEKGEIDVVACKWGRILLKNPDIGADSTLIDVVTKLEFSNYVNSSKHDWSTLSDAVNKTPDLIKDGFRHLRRIMEGRGS